MHPSPPAQNSSTLFQLRASAAQPARPRLSGHSVSARNLVPVYPTLPNSFLVIPCPPNALTFFVTRSMHPDPQRHTQLFMPVRGFPKGSRFPFPCRVRFFVSPFFLTFSCSIFYILLGLFWVVLMSLLSQNGAQNHQKCVQKSTLFRCCVLMAFLSSFWHLPTLKNLLFHCTCQQNQRYHHFDACLFFGLFLGYFWTLFGT